MEAEARPGSVALLPQPRAAVVVVPPAARPLDEIAALESEWREKVQPHGLHEETLCAQLAHATWHLRSLQRAEREAIAASVRQGSFNGEAAMSMMQWRLSAEQAVNGALEQLQSCRRMEQRALPADGTSDLLALIRGVEHQASATHATA